MDRPVLTDSITEETWNAFDQSWQVYLRANDVQQDERSVQLYSCCDMPLKTKLTAMNPNIINEPVDNLLALLKTLTVIPVAKTVKRNELLQMQQDAGEGIRTFLSRVKGKAITCTLHRRCTHPHAAGADGRPPPDPVLVDFTDEWIRHVLLNGMYDDEIRRDVFGHHDLDTLDINALVTLIEGKETARDATRGASNNALSTHRRSNQERSNRENRDDGRRDFRENRDNVRRDNRDVREDLHRDNRPIDHNQQGTCATCGTSIRLYKKMARSGKFNKNPFTNCQECWKKLNKSQPGEASAISFDITCVELMDDDTCDNESTMEHGTPTSDEPLTESTIIQHNTDIGSSDRSHTEPFVEPCNATAHDSTTPLDSACHIEVEEDEPHDSSSPNPPIISPSSMNDYSDAANTNNTSPLQPTTPLDEEGAAQAAESVAAVQLPIALRHHIFKDGRWMPNPAKPHPKVKLTAFTRRSDYEFFGLRFIPMTTQDIEVITDSGAMVPVWGWSDCKRAGFNRNDLIPAKQKLNGVCKSTIKIYGAVLLRMYGISPEGEKMTCAVMVYVSPDVSGFYLSEDAMLQLKIVPQNFPHVGSAASVSSVECACTPRTATPGRPEELPMKASIENIPAMEQWLRDRYASSTFNNCPHKPIPSIQGPPLRIYVDPNAKPTHAFTKTPLHWVEETDADLDKDVAMKVIEKVPRDEPPRWIHRCVYTRKSNGKIRRTVDLSPLNKHCVREAHPMRSPFELAKGIPPNTWRTVTDAFNGYHSVPLHPDDRHLTTFSTNKGLFRYLRAPQGFASSGDGYNRRLDEITADFVRYNRCVDDGCHYDADDDLELHWWRTIDLLELMGRHGVTLNPNKFQFCKKDIDFAGFRLTGTTISPLPKYLDSIRNFPTPKSITDIRAWFGLVNQVSHYAQLRDLVETFRQFLSPKVNFFWNEELENIFNASKEAIIQMIKEGVQIYDVNRKTCLRCDWSQEGIGFYLMQKHCPCDSNHPDCCEDGWKVTLCGSRFMKKAETRYAPIEGEALAVAWALEQTKYFTLGCDDLIVVVDHKPLTKVLGDRTLDEIPNPRLFRIKQRTLPWIYQIYWMPGKCNSFSDAISRNPATDESSNTDDESTFVSLINDMSGTDDEIHPVCCAVVEDEVPLEQVAALTATNLDKVFAITWDRVQSATHSEYEDLLCTVQKGFPANKSDLDKQHQDFWNYRNGLHVFDNVIMYQDRIVIPPSLRIEILQTLHAAHQGPGGMMSTAQSTVFWPGISIDIERERQLCKTCTRNAPSQPNLDPVPPIFPTTPFEAVVGDYFKLRGMNYLVIADRLSAWTECYRTKSGTDDSGSRGLIQLLKRFFGTFGVPQELSNDGGSEFTADDTQDFLTRWGVRVRQSAAYNPQSNGRAELAVKSTKRLIEDNVGPDGELDTERFLRAILIKRNTPDSATKLSPAEIVFGRKLRDTMPRIDKTINIFFNKAVQPTWTDAWEKKELAMRARYQGCQKRLAEHSKSLPNLVLGDRVSIQNQSGNRPAKWDRSGTVVEIRDFDKHIIRVDASGRLTLRNRRYLRKLFEDVGLYGTRPGRKTCHSKHSPAEDNVPSAGTSSTNGTTNQSNGAHIPQEPPRRQPTQPANNHEQPSSLRNELSTSNTMVQDLAPAVTDRPRRAVSRRLCYDAHKGKYVPCDSGDCIDA